MSENKNMTKIHQAVMTALLPFCIAKTKALRDALAAPVAVASDRIAAVKAVLTSDSYERHVAGGGDNWTRQIVALIGAATGQDLSAAIPTTTGNGQTDYPAGAVVVVIDGQPEHKRVKGKGYLVAAGSTEPTPLGIRGEFNGRRFNKGGRKDIRLATDEEITATLAKLNDRQVKTLVCELSAAEPWRSVLAEVIRNDGQGYCKR